MVKIAKPIDVTALYRVYVRSDVDENYVDVATWRTDWEMHPDRAGYMCPWTPSDGNIILVLGKREQLTEFVDQQTNDLRNRQSAMRTRIELGEIDKRAASKEFNLSIKKAREAIAKRALAL
jgi:hypothetical protein